MLLEWLILPHTDPIERMLDDASARLDELLGEVRAGVRGAEHFDELESRAAGIASDLRRAFRGGRR